MQHVQYILSIIDEMSSKTAKNNRVVSNDACKNRVKVRFEVSLQMTRITMLLPASDLLHGRQIGTFRPNLRSCTGNY